MTACDDIFFQWCEKLIKDKSGAFTATTIKLLHFSHWIELWMRRHKVSIKQKKKAYLSRQKTELRERLDCIIMTMAFSISVIFSITHSSFATSWMFMWDMLELKEVQRAATALLKSIQFSVYMQNPHWIHVIKYAATLPPF